MFNAEINADTRGLTWASALKCALKRGSEDQKVRKIKASGALNFLIPTMKPLTDKNTEESKDEE